MHKKVKIITNGKIAYVVWYSKDYYVDPNNVSYLLDLTYEDEMPEFYERNEFELI